MNLKRVSCHTHEVWVVRCPFSLPIETNYIQLSFLPERYSEFLVFASRLCVLLQLISVLLYLSSFSFIFFLFIICLPLNLLNCYIPIFIPPATSSRCRTRPRRSWIFRARRSRLLFAEIPLQGILFSGSRRRHRTRHSIRIPVPLRKSMSVKWRSNRAPYRHRLPAGQAG